MLAKALHLLKELNDRDVLEEEVILEWSKKTSKKYVSKELSQVSSHSMIANGGGLK